MFESTEVVVLAGGKGERLLPRTTDLPKPLLPVAGTSTLAVLLHTLGDQGFGRVTLALWHLASAIQEFGGDGSRFGIDLRYSIEESPLSTAGPLKLIDSSNRTLLAINSDLLTTLQYDRLLRAHRQSSAAATVVVVSHSVDLDYGVLEIEGENISRFIEKPRNEFLISLGINAIERTALDAIQPGEAVDMPTFINRLVDRGEKVSIFRAVCEWLDVGRPQGFEHAGAFIQRHFSYLMATPP